MLQASNAIASDGMAFVQYVAFSDIIVRGEVVKSNDDDFQIRIDEQLKGFEQQSIITIDRDPICKCKEYYKLNTTAVFFLFKIEEAHYKMFGNETLVVMLNEGICYSSNFRKVTLDVFRSAISSFSDQFQLSGSMEKVEDVKLIALNEEFEKYKNSSEFHQFIAEGILKQKQRIEKKNKRK